MEYNIVAQNNDYEVYKYKKSEYIVKILISFFGSNDMLVHFWEYCISVIKMLQAHYKKWYTHKKVITQFYINDKLITYDELLLCKTNCVELNKTKLSDFIKILEKDNGVIIITDDFINDGFEEVQISINTLKYILLESVETLDMYIYQYSGSINSKLLFCLPFIGKLTMNYSIFVNEKRVSGYDCRGVYLYNDLERKHYLGYLAKEWIMDIYNKYVIECNTDFNKYFRKLIMCILNEEYKSGADCVWAKNWSQQFCSELKQWKNKLNNPKKQFLYDFINICEKNEMERQYLENNNKVNNKLCRLIDYDQIMEQYYKNKKNLENKLLEIINYHLLITKLGFKKNNNKKNNNNKNKQCTVQ
jgi:hypothetical protein